MQKSGPNKKMFSLGKKLTFLILLMALTLSSATILFGYQTYKRSMENHFITLGQNLATTAANLVDGDKLDGYLESGDTDRDYEETLALMRLLKEGNDIAYLYVVKPTETGTYYIYDTDESEDRCELGYFEEWYEDFQGSAQRFLKGESIDPIISNESFGWLLSVYAPIYGSDGEVAGYVGADFEMDSVVHDQKVFLLTLVIITSVIILVFAWVYLYVIQKTIVHPINRMAKAADDFLVGQDPQGGTQVMGTSSLAGLIIKTNDEIQSLAESMKSMEQKINEYILSLDVATKKAETDSLTGLQNREAFQRKVTALLHSDEDEDTVHAFIMIDVDSFKHTNDTFGHVVGDEVLKACAKTLRQVFRSVDEVVRMGGDEFAVFCKNVGSVRIAEDKAKQLCEAWRTIRIEGAEDCRVTASVGISLVPQNGKVYLDLYQKADAALYKAKVEGRDRYVLYNEKLCRPPCEE